MPRKKGLPRGPVVRWLAGQIEAQRLMEREKRRDLRRLDPVRTLEIYLDLKALPSGPKPPLKEPSPVLKATRKAFRAWNESKSG